MFTLSTNNYNSIEKMESSVYIGNRIKEVRLTLKLSQEEFAALAGATRQSQSNYEKGARMPDALYFAAIAAAGADVQYILTGIHSENYPGSSVQRSSVNDKSSQNLSDKLDRCSEKEIQAIMQLIDLFLEKGKS